MARTQQKFRLGVGIGERISIANICRSLDAGAIQNALAVTGKSSRRKRDFPAEIVDLLRHRDGVSLCTSTSARFSSA